MKRIVSCSMLKIWTIAQIDVRRIGVKIVFETGPQEQTFAYICHICFYLESLQALQPRSRSLGRPQLPLPLRCPTAGRPPQQRASGRAAGHGGEPGLGAVVEGTSRRRADRAGLSPCSTCSTCSACSASSTCDEVWVLWGRI